MEYVWPMSRPEELGKTTKISLKGAHTPQEGERMNKYYIGEIFHLHSGHSTLGRASALQVLEICIGVTGESADKKPKNLQGICRHLGFSLQRVQLTSHRALSPVLYMEIQFHRTHVMWASLGQEVNTRMSKSLP